MILFLKLLMLVKLCNCSAQNVSKLTFSIHFAPPKCRSWTKHVLVVDCKLNNWWPTCGQQWQNGRWLNNWQLLVKAWAGIHISCNTFLPTSSTSMTSRFVSRVWIYCQCQTNTCQGESSHQQLPHNCELAIIAQILWTSFQLVKLSWNSDIRTWPGHRIHSSFCPSFGKFVMVRLAN